MFDAGELDLPDQPRPGAVRRPDPEVRLRDSAASRGITERSAYRTVTDLAEAGSVVRQKNRRRNRYQTRAHLPLPEPGSQERIVGDVLALLAGTAARP